MNSWVIAFCCLRAVPQKLIQFILFVCFNFVCYTKNCCLTQLIYTYAEFWAIFCSKITKMAQTVAIFSLTPFVHLFCRFSLQICWCRHQQVSSQIETLFQGQCNPRMQHPHPARLYPCCWHSIWILKYVFTIYCSYFRFKAKVIRLSRQIIFIWSYVRVILVSSRRKVHLLCPIVSVGKPQW